MARKNIVPSFALFENADLSTSLVSPTVNVQNMDGGGIHLAWSGASGTSTVTVQARNGSEDSWYDLDFGVPITIATASGDHLLQFLDFPFTDIQLLISGATAGSLDGRVTLKQVGG